MPWYYARAYWVDCNGATQGRDGFQISSKITSHNSWLTPRGLNNFECGLKSVIKHLWEGTNILQLKIAT